MQPVSPEAIQYATEQVRSLGKEEVLALSIYRLAQFLFDRYWRGTSSSFRYFGANPTSLTSAEKAQPATLFLHGAGGNQGSFSPMLNRLEKENLGPCFTLNTDEEHYAEALRKKIAEIQALYGCDVKINLVGHSLGAIEAVRYAIDKDSQVLGTTVNKVISIAGRLQNLPDPEETPFYAYCRDALLKIKDLNFENIPLYTITAGADWLVPTASSDVGNQEKVTVSGKGHLNVLFARKTTEWVVNFLRAA